VLFRSAKNKIDKPYLSGPIYIRFGEGFDNINSIVELACNTNVIKKSGALYTFNMNGKELINVTGKEQLRQTLEKDSGLLQTLTGSLVYKEDEQAKIEGEQEETQEGTGTAADLENMLEQASETFVREKKIKAAKKS
jgi:hypothetical protein